MKNSSKFEHDMNSALDQELSAAEWNALQARLVESTEDAERWEHMQQVDDVFHSTPMVAPSPGFAGRVMAAIAALHLSGFANRELGVGVALGLMTAAFLTIPLFSVLLFLLWGVITDPGALNALLQAATSATSTVVGLATDLGSEIRTGVRGSPIVLALLTTIIPVTMLWAWVVWYLLGGRQFMAQRRAAKAQTVQETT
jgi:hypothetical protein